MTNYILKTQPVNAVAPQIGAQRQIIPCPRGNKRWKNCKKQGKITPCSFLLCLFLKLVGWWMISNFRGNALNFPLAKVTIKHGEIANVAAKALSFIRVPLIQHRFDQCISPIPDYLSFSFLESGSGKNRCGRKKNIKKVEGAEHWRCSNWKK